MLENKGSVLPLKKGSRVALFGRMQTHYYKSGTGSGGTAAQRGPPAGNASAADLPGRFDIVHEGIRFPDTVVQGAGVPFF